jgi:ribosome-associated translation inhibitor RaiA
MVVPMKTYLECRHCQLSPSVTTLVQNELESLRPSLQIHEARVFIEHRVEQSPPFHIAAHLVTPGPDVFAQSVDHTLQAALGKLMTQLRDRIDHRNRKRDQSGRKPLRTSPQNARS